MTVPSSVDRAVAEVSAGRPVVVVDDVCSGEGDLVVAAALATTGTVAFTVRHTSGFLCVALPDRACDRLELATQLPRPGGLRQTVSVDAVVGVSTGISAGDRARTIALLGRETSVIDDFTRPGHVPALRVRANGVLDDPGRAEAAADLAFLAGHGHAAALAGIVSPASPTRMATGDELAVFADEHGLALVTITDLLRHRLRHETRISRTATIRPPTTNDGLVTLRFTCTPGGVEHMAFVPASASAPPAAAAPVTVHVECPLGDTFGHHACDCDARLRADLHDIARSGSGVLLYLRHPTGRRVLECAAARDDATHDLEVPVSVLAGGMLADLGIARIQIRQDQADLLDPQELAARGITVVSATDPRHDELRSIGIRGGHGTSLAAAMQPTRT
jgi:3,4-dihydroxy 2-butanone 4-phosphate synthase/GTP cyclohydrolase II